jgi:cystathionine beta-synthase
VRFHESVVDLIGDTPLVRLNRVAAGLPPTMLAKLEYFNPGGSVKDRIALRMVTAAEQDGRLRPGGTIVEPTSGNTGVGLALVAQQRGYRCVFACPDKVSPDKIALLRAYGAEVVVCPAAVPPDHPDSYRSVSARLGREIPGAHRLDQYSNPDNAASHYHLTGPELWAQTEGRITHFVAGVGTGGTISGTGRYLKGASGGQVQVIGADPDGSVYSGGVGRPYLLEGVGQPSLPDSFDPTVPDRIIAVTDQESVTLTRRLAREDGILTGGSGGMAVAAALRVATECGAADVVVVLIPDSGRGYLSKIFDEGWLRRFGFLARPDGCRSVGELIADTVERVGLPVVAADRTVTDALQIMRAAGVRHLPVSSAPPPVRLAEITGTVDEATLAARAKQGRAWLTNPVADHMSGVLPVVGWGQPIAEVADTVTAVGAALVADGGIPRGIVTARDLTSGPVVPAGEPTQDGARR